MVDVDPHPPLACSDVRRDSAFGRARAIAAGHTVLCVNDHDDACPMRAATLPARPSALRDMLARMNETLAAGRASPCK